MTVSSTLFLINLERSDCYLCNYKQGRVDTVLETPNRRESWHLERAKEGLWQAWHWAWVGFWQVNLEAGFPGGSAVSQGKCSWVESGNSEWPRWVPARGMPVILIGKIEYTKALKSLSVFIFVCISFSPNMNTHTHIHTGYTVVFSEW